MNITFFDDPRAWCAHQILECKQQLLYLDSGKIQMTSNTLSEKEDILPIYIAKLREKIQEFEYILEQLDKKYP